MKVGDITQAIANAWNVIAELSKGEDGFEKNKNKICRIEALIHIIENAEISIKYGD